MSTFKKTVFVIQCVIAIVLSRKYGNIIFDFAQTYQVRISLTNFRTYERLTTKKRTAELDVAFLKDCQSFGVFPNFLCFPLPGVSNQDTLAIRRRLLRSSILKRLRELRKLNNDLTKKADELKGFMNSLDWSILNKALKKNVDKQVNNQLLTHRKKLKKLTRNKALPFTHKDTVTNLSSPRFPEEELELLKNGL